MKSTTARTQKRPAATPRKRTARAPRRRADAHEKPLILLVDDFRDNREMYAEYLANSGFAVEEAENGQEALDKAFARRPDLVVMDLSLPGIDGWEATRRLKTDERTAGVPVVVVTGHALERLALAAKEAGCDRFLTKPCLPQVLLEEIRRTLAGKGTSHARAKP